MIAGLEGVKCMNTTKRDVFDKHRIRISSTWLAYLA